MGTELGKMRTQEVMMMLENPEKLVVWTWSQGCLESRNNAKRPGEVKND